MRKSNKKRASRTSRQAMLVTNEGIPFEFSEAYKSLRTNIKFLSAAQNAKSFVITSSLPMESKTNVTINLALTLAKEGRRVVLLDCDFRKPMIRNYLGISVGGLGIVDALVGQCDLKNAIYRSKTINIDVIPVGTIPPNPSELLATDQMKAVINELKKNYDYVIIDSPPISVVTDAAIIGSMVDGAFLVVRSDYAPMKSIDLAKKTLNNVNVKIFGAILTRFNPKKSGKQSAYYYSYENYYENDTDK